jgi:diguanylate cyclase (GGDEF)-like protein
VDANESRRLSRQKSELDDFAAGRRATVSSVSFADGMRSSEANGGNQPAGCVLRDGRILFPTIKGIVSIDPRRIFNNPQPPPVLVEGVTVNDKSFAAVADDHARLAPGAERLEFHYAALSFLDPERVRFKYKLEGFDPDWIDAGTRRVAYYTNLAPGKYLFRVIACNNDGVWNETGAAFGFEIAPHFYQTFAFHCLLVLLAVGLVLLIIRLRLGALRRRERELVSLVKERTQQLEDANSALVDANAQLQNLSSTDSLTGIANRRAFDAFLNREWRRALREQTPLTLLLLDIDRFKQLNDTYGHQAGDECLRRAANVIAGIFKRSSDLVARYGGEEFAVVLCFTNRKFVGSLAERVRVEIEQASVECASAPDALLRLTVSVGGGIITPRSDAKPEDLIAAADRALYQAKNAGRNCARIVNLDDTEVAPDVLFANQFAGEKVSDVKF